MPITFGSVGDIISLSLLIKDLVKSLDDSRGSAAEYQAVIRELWSLDSALLQVELLFQSCEQTPELNALSATANQCAEQCRECIVHFRDETKKYHISLSTGGSGNIIKDAVHKVGWRVFEKDYVVAFRAQINAHSTSMNVLLATAGVNIINLNDERLHKRLKQSEQVHESSVAAQSLYFKDIKSRLDDTNALIEAGTSEIRALSSRFDFTYVRHLGANILSVVQKIWRINFMTYNMMVSLQDRVPTSLGGCWKQEPVTLEDALGRVFPIPLELIDSWMAFDSILEVRFRELPGHRKIKQKEYALRSDSLNKDLEHSVAFIKNVYPGQRISMSMVFQSTSMSVSSCPGCKLATPKTEEELQAQIKCHGCGMWYQRIVEATITTPKLEVADLEYIAVHGAYFPEILRSRKRSHDESAEADDDPGQFRRVRLRCWSWQATLSEASDNDKSIEAQPVSHATWSTGQLEAGAPHRPRTEFGEIAPISFANTYWTVEKQQECLNLIKSLGTDWHPIANTMKDTTPLMVKQFYERKIVEALLKENTPSAQNVDETRATTQTEPMVKNGDLARRGDGKSTRRSLRPMAIPSSRSDLPPPPLPPPRFIDDNTAGSDPGWAWGGDPTVPEGKKPSKRRVLTAEGRAHERRMRKIGRLQRLPR